MRRSRVLEIVFLAWWFASVGKTKSFAPDIPVPIGPFDTIETCNTIKTWFTKIIEGRASNCWSDGTNLHQRLDRPQQDSKEEAQ